MVYFSLWRRLIGPWFVLKKQVWMVMRLQKDLDVWAATQIFRVGPREIQKIVKHRDLLIRIQVVGILLTVKDTCLDLWWFQ